MITALIQSILSQGNQILVAVLFSNASYPTTYNFNLNDTIDTITSKIQSDLDDMNAAETLLSNLQPLINTTLQSTPNLVNLQNQINTANTKGGVQ